MTDWQSLPFAIDVSHHNGTIDWDKVAAQKPACVLLKATERQWTDPMFERNRKGCADRGIPWIPYVFLRPDDSDRTRQYFIDLIGDRSIPAALDWEAEGVASAPVEGWIDALEAAGGRTPLCYYGLYPPAAVTDKIACCPRWYPQYPGSPTAGPRTPMWSGADTPNWRKCWLIWQWSEKGAINGIPGNVDLNRLACSAEVFLGWYRTGRFAPLAGAQAEPGTATLTAAAAPTPAPAIIGRGSPKPLVKAAQNALIAAGFGPQLGPRQDDGDYGDKTDGAVHDFQDKAGLPRGPLDAATWAKLGPG